MKSNIIKLRESIKTMELLTMRPSNSLPLRFFARTLTIVTAFSVLLGTPSVAVEEMSATSMVKDSSDGNSFLQSLIDRVKALHDYWYESTLTTFTQKGKTVTESGRFYFKAPRMVRFEALKAGKRSGSIVVCQPDGKIKAKAGGVMKGVTVTLSPTSKMLMTSNGYNILESDLSTLLQSLRSSIKSGLKCVASSSPCAYPGLPRSYVLELLSSDDLVTQRIAVDTERKLPAEWAIFNDGKLNSVASMNKIAVNSNITDDMFIIGRKSDDEKSLGGDSNDLVDKLRKKLGTTGISNADSVRDLSQALTELKQSSDSLRQDKLTEHPADRPDSVTWLDFGRSTLLTRTAKMELIAQTLKALQPVIQNFENRHGNCAGTTEQWLNSLKSIDRSNARLYSILESDVPDPDAIVREADSIKAQVIALDAVIVRISESLD